MADKDNKSKLTYHVWDKDNNEYDIPDEVVQQRGMDNFAKDFEGGYITMFDDKRQKVDVPIEDVGDYRKQGYIWYDTSGNATPINEIGKKPAQQELESEQQASSGKDSGLISDALGFGKQVVGEAKKVPGMISSILGLDNSTQQSEQQTQQVDGVTGAAVTEQPAQSPSSTEPSQLLKNLEGNQLPQSEAMNNIQMDERFANYLNDWHQRPNKEGNYFENFVADLEAEGANPEEAIKATQNALNRYANRSALGVTNQVVSSLPDDTVQDAEKSIEAQWYSHGVQDKLKQDAHNMGINYDDYVAQYLKPAMVESLVQKYGPNYRNIAEGIATRLYSHDENVQDRLMNLDIDKALSDVISKYVNPSVVNEYMKAQEAGSQAFGEGMEGSQYIPANLRLGAALGAQYEANQVKDPQKTLDLLQKKFGTLYKNPQFQTDMANAAFKVMQGYGLNGGMMGDPKQFKPMIDAVLKNQLDHLEASQMIPKGSAEYIMNTGLGNTIVGKITRKLVQTDYQNWLQDIANQQYQPGFWERVGSGALTFAGDAWSYWLPGAAGGKITKNMIAKAEGKLASDLMAKGMETKMAERAAKVLIGKSKAMALKTGAASGAVTFGGQSSISKPIDEIYRTGQFDENGKKYNPSVGKVIANTLGEVAKQSAVGAIMQGGTIANMVGKGRGLATNILADVGGKAVDSTIMAGQQTLEHMAQDPSFKPTGKDFAESALESMANLTSIGLPGLMGKYARFKDAREFNRKFDFTNQDIAELKRIGYDDLRDAFEKMGIGEIAVTGDNVQRLDGQLTQKYMDMMNDKSVPETLKAKMMAVVEGKRPSSFSPVVDSVIVQPMDNDGKVYLETLNKDGAVIDRKEYSSREDAEKADKKLEYEKTLGLASVLEGEFHKEFTQEHLDGLYNQAAQKYNMGEKLTDEEKAAVYLHQNAGTINDIMQKQQKGIILSADEQKQVDAYRHFYDSALENSSVMREFVNTFEDSHGVARGTLRKALESRDKKYEPLVESYLKELYNSIELKREMKQTVDDLYNTSHGRDQKRIEQNGAEGGSETPAESDGSVPTPYQDRTNSVPSPSDANSAANLANSPSDVPPAEPPTPPASNSTASQEQNAESSDAYVMGQTAYQNGDVEGLQAINHNDDVAKARLKRAFADDEAKMNVVLKAYEEGKDMEQFLAQRAGYMTPVQQDAVRKYVEAQNAKNGALDALQHADDGYADALKEQLWPYQTEDGNIVPATLASGQQVFLKKANKYDGGFVVVPDENGNPSIKQVANADIKEVGTPISLDDYINQQVTEQKNARQQQFFSQFDGSGLKPNDTVEVAIEPGTDTIQMQFAGYSPDGKVILSDGKDQIPLTKEEFNAWRQNALDASIDAELDSEDAQRANDDAAKAEADKQERYKKGIFGYAAGQPDYSDPQTEPKVAAEYLQETAGEDRKALFANIAAEKKSLQTRINQLKEHIASNEEWLSINTDLDPKNAETRTLANKQMQGQIADLQARFDNWNKIRSAVMTPEEATAIQEDRTKKIADAGVNESDITSIDGREIAVLSDEELKKQYPTMDEASNYIASERKRIYRIQSDEVQREIDGVDDVLNRYVSGEIDLEPEQIKELNTIKAQLQARQQNLTESAKDLKAQADKLNTLYRKENMEARAKTIENMTPAEQRAVKVENAIKSGNLSQLNSIYEEVRGATDFNDTEPNTLEEYVANNIGRFSLNYEGKEKGGAFSNGIQQETGLGRNDFNKLQILAKQGEGKTVPEFVQRLYDNMPEHLKQMGYTDQDIRDAFLNIIGSAENYSDIKNYTLNNKVADAEQKMQALEQQEAEMREAEEGKNFSERLQNAIAETETEPTDAQKKAGNYKKGHLQFGGYDFTVETPKGATRSGKDEQGKPWSVTMHDTYGYIKGKIGVDGDQIDMFINDDADLDTFDGNVMVIDQVNPNTGEFDEHKVMYGYPDEAAAISAYLKNYSKGWKGLGKLTSVPKATFDKWLESSDRKTKPFRDYAMVQHEEAKKVKQDENLPFGAQMNLDDLPFDRDVKEVKPKDMTEPQKVAFEAVSTMLKKAGIPVKVISNEDMEKVAEKQDNLRLSSLLNSPVFRFQIKTPEQKEAAKAAYDWAVKHRPDKYAQYAIVNMDRPNQMPEYFEKKSLAEQWRKYYTNQWGIGNYKGFDLNKPFEEQIKNVVGKVPEEFDPYKKEDKKEADKLAELKKQKEELVKQRDELYAKLNDYNFKRNKAFFDAIMDYRSEHPGEEIPDSFIKEATDKSIGRYDPRPDLNRQIEEVDAKIKANNKEVVKLMVADNGGVSFMRTYHGSGADFDEFDFDHMSEGAGSQVFGWGGYVTSSKKIGKSYADLSNMAARGYIYKGDANVPKAAINMIATTLEAHPNENIKEFLKNRVEYYSAKLKQLPGNKFAQQVVEKNKIALNYIDKIDLSDFVPRSKNLYEVEIPDDKDENYLDWDSNVTQKLKDRVFSALVDDKKKDYVTLLKENGFNDKQVERALSSLSVERYKNAFDTVKTGEDLYRAISKNLVKSNSQVDDDKAASQFLSSLGFTGIKYKAGRNFGGVEEGDTNYVIFKPEDMQIVDHNKFAKGKGTVYGYTDGQSIVLNQDHLNPNTPIHEYAHIWRTAAKAKNPDLIAHGDKLIKETEWFQSLLNDPNYKHLSEDKLCDEAFARLTGDGGADILEQMANDAIKENPLDTAKELSIINRLKKWLKQFWYWTLETFTKWKPEDIKKMTLEDIRNLTLRDLAQGVDPRAVLNEHEAKEFHSIIDQVFDDENFDKSQHLRERYDLGKTPEWMQGIGIKGDNFSLSFKSIKVHQGKDSDHDLTKEEWHALPEALKHPFAITRYQGAKDRFRLYVNIYHDGKPVAVGMDVKRVNQGKNKPQLDVNSIKTVFAHQGVIGGGSEVLVTYDKEITPKQQELLRGLNFHEYPTIQELSAAKVSKSFETTKGNGEKVSLADDKTLAGVHNITEDKLRKALKLGGLANPSLAVIDTAKSGHSNFGEISFIAPSALVDKRTGKTAGTWTTDAYTQRYPSVERQMTDKGYENFKKWVDGLDYSSADKSEILRQTKDVLEDNGVPAWELMYLNEKGIDLKGYDSDVDYRWQELIENHPTSKDILDAMKSDPELNDKVTKLAKSAIVKPTWSDISKNVRKQIYKETGVKVAPINPKVRAKVKEIFERDYAPQLLNKDGSPRKADVEKIVEDMVKQYNDTKKYSFYKSKVKASSYVNKNGLYPDYIRWQENKLDEFGTKNRIFRGYKNDGTRKYVPETLENVSKAMREEANGQTNGGEYTSFGSFIAKLADRVDSTEEMRANKDKLSSNEDKEAFYNKWEEVYYDLAKSLYNDVMYGEERLHDIVMQPDPKKYAKKEYGITLTPSFMKKLDALKTAVREELKSGYFETKFDRPVRLNEFAAVVVPNNLGADVRKGLEKAGLALYDYDPNVEGDRERVFDKAVRSKEGIRFMFVGEKGAAEADNRGRIVGGENDGLHYSKVYGKKANVKMNLGESASFVREQREINNDFNDALDKQIAGTLPKGYTYQLGKPSSALKFAGIDDLPIELSSRTLEVKSSKDYKSNHPFNLASIKNLPIAIQHPVAIFDSEYENGRKVILTELKDDKGHSIIAVLGLRKLRGRNYAEVNSIISLYGKDSAVRIANWFDSTNKNGLGLDKQLCRWADTKKASEWLTNNASYVHSVGLSPKRIAKIINSFVNNQFPEENLLVKHNFGNILGNNSGLSADEERKIADSVVNTSNQLGGAEANVYTSLDDVPEEYRSEVEQGAKGWYDPETHTVHVYLPNCEDGDDAQRTVFHEKVGHEGMEVLLGGEQGVRKFADFVYKSVGKGTRGKILDFAKRYDEGWQNPDRMNVGTQEYIAHLAEEGPKTAEDFSLWTKIKHYLIKVLKKLGIRVPGLLNDKDLRYYLMKAGKALHVWDNMPKEKQEAMMAQASNAEIKDALSDGAGKGKPRQKKGESAIQYMKRVMEWKRWKEAREDTDDPEPPMFYDFDKDADGKKEWERLNKEWRDSHGLKDEEMPLRPERKEGESDEAFMNRYKEWEKWNDAIVDKENPMPDMFAFEKQKQDEARQKYEDWLTRHELNEQQQADLDLYDGKIYPAETNPKADALEQEVMQDLADVTSTDVSKEGAATTVKHAVIHRRKNMEEASAYDAIYINDIKTRIEEMVDSGIFDNLLADYEGKPTKAEKLAEAIPYIIEAPRRIREIAFKLNSTGVFGEGHIHITPNDVESIQELRPELAKVTANTHTELKDGKEVELFDDMKGATEMASKVANIINGNHDEEPGFVPIDGTDILNKKVLPIILKAITPYGVIYKELSEPMKATIRSIRDWYDYFFDWLKDNNTLKADAGFTIDYVNHLWDKEKSDKQAYAMYVENRQRTKSPNEKPREINTLMEGRDAKLVPKTTDITKMMAYYSRSNIEAWANKAMLQEVSGLNVIERNEDGEIISSDPLLSSVAPFNLEQYKYFEIPGVGPVWVYNVSPKQVTVKNPITGKDNVLYREASAGDRFGVVFDTYQSTPFWKTFDTLASSMKKLELGFSGFHAGALTEVYMVQNMVEFGPKKALANFMKYIFVDTMKNHQLPCFANPDDFQEAATHLVKFGATNDYAAADVQNMFDNFRDAMMKIQEKLDNGSVVGKTGATVSTPFKVASQMLSLINKGMDRALWDFLHDGLKLATYSMRAEKTKARAKAKGWTDEQLSKALDEDGQFVNDMFGGQHWDILGASHRVLRYAGRVLLSPDWNASTTRHFLALTGYGSVWNDATMENFKKYYKNLWSTARGKGELSPEEWGRTTRQISALLCYGIGFMVFYEAFANAINAAFRAMDEEKESKKAEEIRKTNPDYKSPYELAYPDGMKWYDYLMRGNTLGQQSKIFVGRYADGTEMYVRHGKQFREVPEYLFNHKGELEFPGPMVQRLIGKANPMVRMTLDDINYLSDFQASHADQDIQRKYGKTIGLLYKNALYWAPFLIPSQENKEFKAVDFFFPSSKGFSNWKAQDYFKNFILSGDMEGVMMTYQSCQRNGIDAEKQLQAAISSIKALESKEMQDGVTSLQIATKRFDEAKSITEKRKMREKMKKFLSQSEYKAFTAQEALDMVKAFQGGVDPKEMMKADDKYLNVANSADVTEDWRIQQVRASTKGYADKLSELKDTNKAKAGAFKNAHANVFKARKAISKATTKMNKLKKKLGEGNDKAILQQIRTIRKDLLKDLNGMEHLKEYKD